MDLIRRKILKTGAAATVMAAAPRVFAPGRRSGAPVRRRHGVRDARTERRGEHVPVEGAQGTNSARSTPDTFLPSGPSARFCLEGNV